MTLDCKGKGTPTAWSGQSSTGYYCFISNVAVDINSPEPEPLCQSQADQAGLRLEEVKAVVGSMKKYQCVIGPQPTFACPTGFMPSGDTCAKPVSQAPTVSYTCSAGTLTASNTCKVTSTVAANKAYTCDSGKTLKVDRCEYTVVDRVSVLQRPKCDSGYALEGGQCVATSGVPAISAPSCNSGYTLESGQCKLYVTDRATPGTSYGCPEGGTLSSSTCTRSDTKAPTSEYYCADVSYTLSGSQCSKTTVLKTTPTSAYGCAANAVLEAGNVCRAIGTGTISYTCGSGTLSGSNCLGANQGTAYIHLGGKLIAETVVGGTTQYVHTDALGSPVARTGAAKEVISRTRYEPYGYVAAGTKPSASTSQIGFTGHVQDAETELVYMQQRYYDPIAGRFLSIDPVTTEADTGKEFGRYTYVDNNPYAKVDPDGALSEAFWASPNRIVVTIPYRITQNRNATLGFTRAAFERQVARDFSGSVQVGDRTIQMEVRAEERTTGRANEIQVVESTAGVTQSGREETRGGLMGNPVNTIVIDSATSVDVASHEMGHAGGAGDQYRGGLSRNHQTLAADVPGPANRMRNNGPARANRQTRNELAERHVKKETD